MMPGELFAPSAINVDCAAKTQKKTPSQQGLPASLRSYSSSKSLSPFHSPASHSHTPANAEKSSHQRY
jgi:hypothetical protein